MGGRAERIDGVVIPLNSVIIIKVDMNIGTFSAATLTQDLGVLWQDDSLKSGEWYPTFELNNVPDAI